jgi:hypothetical protein
MMGNKPVLTKLDSHVTQATQADHSQLHPGLV